MWGSLRIRTLIAAATSWLVLLAAVQVGLRVPGFERLHGLPAHAALEYLPWRIFSPLTPAFIARVLGLQLSAPEVAGVSKGPAARERQPEPAVAGPPSSPRFSVTHGLDNDDREGAFTVASLPFTARTQTAGATREADEPADCAPVGGTVWYRYRPPQDAGLIANTFGSDHSTALAVYEIPSGAGPGPLGEPAGQNMRMVRCDVDAAGNAQTPFRAWAGTVYLFRVTAPAGGGALVFSLDPVGRTTRISGSRSEEASPVWPAGGQYPAISADGRFVAFEDGTAERLWGSKPTAVYLHDRLTAKDTMVSVSSSGAPANDDSWSAAISPEGRYVAFYSYASNLVPDDTNGEADAFLHDLLTGTTIRVSVPFRKEAIPAPHHPVLTATLRGLSIAVSAGGRFVAFESHLPNLVPNDGNACTEVGFVQIVDPIPPAAVPTAGVEPTSCRDVFVRDVVLQTTERVSVSSTGTESNGDSSTTHLSPDGRYVVFSSTATTLVDGDTNMWRDVFVHDRATGRTSLVSVGSSGEPGDRNSGDAMGRGHTTISADGRYVAFASEATNLVPNDDNRLRDLFVHDRLTRKTTRVSVASDGAEADRASGQHAAISADGRFVAFTSDASNLAPDQGGALIDVYVHDRVTATTVRASVSSTGEGGDANSSEPDISADGRFVVFHSNAGNLDDDADQPDGASLFLHQLW